MFYGIYIWENFEEIIALTYEWKDSQLKQNSVFPRLSCYSNRIVYKLTYRRSHEKTSYVSNYAFFT